MLEDIAQEALVRTWGRWVGVRNPHAYAYLVATNLVRQHWRAAARQRDTVHAQRITSAMTVDVTGDLRDLVERLPEPLRVPVLLHYYADLPISDVARLMHRPLGTIKRRLHEARQRLAVEYGDDA